MKQHPILRPYILPYMVWINFFLQSCLSSPHEAIPIKEHPYTTQVAIEQLIDKRFVAQGGYRVHLYEQAGYLRANVEETLLLEGFNKTYYNFPVYIVEGIDLIELASLDQEAQKSLIHVKLKKDAQPGYVYIGHTTLTDSSHVPVTNKDTDWSALHVAAKKGYAHIVELFIEQGEDIHAKSHNGDSPLHLATSKGHIAVVRLLLEHGADVNEEDQEGFTPLHIAVLTNQIDVARVLLEHGADVNIQNQEGISPLHMAASNGQEAIARLLLEQGAKVNMKCKDGWTSLHAAACDGHEQLVNLLLAHGAEVKEQEVQDGNTPLQLAIQNGHTAVANLLIERYKVYS